MRRTSGCARRSILGAAASMAMMPQNHVLAQESNIEFGRYLASECMTCHRSATVGGAIPNIFGMAAPRFVVLVKAYRDKQLPNPVMQNVAGRLKDDEIDALAHFFAVTKRP